MPEYLDIPKEKWLKAIESAPEKDLFIRMVAKGLMVIPAEFWTDSIKDSAKVFNILGGGSHYAFLNTEGRMSLFSEAGILEVLAKG